MFRRAASFLLVPFASLWVKRQERRILRRGVALDELQQEDARRVGVVEPGKVRLRIVDEVPPRLHPLIKRACQKFGMADAVGMTLRYGIYIRAENWGDRSILVHELAHTAQYERAGSIAKFLRRYLRECLCDGYEHSALEREAERLSREVCKR